MKSADILSKTDATSWSRIAMVARYFWPRLKNYLILAPVVSAVFTLIAMQMTDMMFKQYVMFLLALLIVLAPVKLSRRPDGDFTYTLPALGWEKCTVLFGIFFLIIPALVIIPSEIVARLFGGSPESLGMPEMSSGNTVLMSIGGWIMIYSSLAVCLWAVMSTNRNRAVKGVISALICMFVLTAVTAFATGFCMAFFGMDESVSTGIYIQQGVSLIVFVIFIFKSINAISHRQI